MVNKKILGIVAILIITILSMTIVSASDLTDKTVLNFNYETDIYPDYDSRTWGTQTTGGDPVRSTGQARYGDYSYHFDGNDYIVYDKAMWNKTLGIGNYAGTNFTFSFSFYPTSNASLQEILSPWNKDGSGDWEIEYFTNGKVNMHYIDGSPAYADCTTTGTYALNEWHDVQMLYEEASITLIVDGDSISCNDGIGNFQGFSKALTLGKGDNGDYFTGYIDNILFFDHELNSTELYNIQNEDYPFIPNFPPIVNITTINDTIFTDSIVINGTVTDSNLKYLVINSINFDNDGTNESFSFVNNTYIEDGIYTLMISAQDTENLTYNKQVTFEVINPYTYSEQGINNYYWETNGDYSTGNFGTTMYDNGLILNNSYSGLYCSKVIDTDFLNVRYGNFTYDIDIDPVPIPNGLDFTDLRAWYQMEDAGTSIADSSDYNITGTYNGILNEQTGSQNYSLGMDGVNDFIDLGTSDNFRFYVPFTLSADVYIDDVSSSYQGFITRDGYPSSRNYWFGKDAGTGKLAFFYTTTSDTHLSLFSTDVVLTSGHWYNVAVRIASDSTLSFIVNGTNVSVTGTNPINPIKDGANVPVYIGRSSNPTDYFIDGKIDNVMLWNRYVTNSELDIITEHNFNDTSFVALDVDFDFRSCDNNCTSEPYTSLTGNSPIDLSSFDKRYFSWCADISTSELWSSPVVYNVSVNFYNASIPFVNTPPTTPSDLLLYPDPLYSNDTLQTGLLFPSTDIDDDNISYYYEFQNSSNIIQAYSLIDFLELNSTLENQTLTVYVKAYDGTDFSGNDSASIYVNEPIFINITGYVSPIQYANDTEAFKLGQCPSTKQGYTNMWIAVISLFVFGIVGLIIKNIALTGGSGALLVFMSLSVMGCGFFLGVIVFIIAFIYIISALSIKT